MKNKKEFSITISENRKTHSENLISKSNIAKTKININESNYILCTYDTIWFSKRISYFAFNKILMFYIKKNELKEILNEQIEDFVLTDYSFHNNQINFSISNEKKVLNITYKIEDPNIDLQKKFFDNIATNIKDLITIIRERTITILENDDMLQFSEQILFAYFINSFIPKAEQKIFTNQELQKINTRFIQYTKKKINEIKDWNVAGGVDEIFHIFDSIDNFNKTVLVINETYNFNYGVVKFINDNTLKTLFDKLKYVKKRYQDIGKSPGSRGGIIGSIGRAVFEEHDAKKPQLVTYSDCTDEFCRLCDKILIELDKLS